MTTLIILHSLLRWITIVFLLISVYRSLLGWRTRNNYTGYDNIVYMATMIILHIQLLVGLTTYLVSPLIQHAMDDFGKAMGNAEMRYFALEHPLMMVIAIALVTIGKIYAGKASTSYIFHKRTFLFYALAFLIILFATPWPFSSIPRPYIG